MITLLVLALVATTLVLGAVPFVAYALMLESTAARAKAAGVSEAPSFRMADESEAPVSLRLVTV
jgi:hypothetical protein